MATVSDFIMNLSKFLETPHKLCFLIIVEFLKTNVFYQIFASQ
jgi:hypothetical protein